MTQALHLANGTTINEKLRDPKGAVARAIDAKTPDAEIIDRLFLVALCRRPTDSERLRLLKLIAEAGDNQRRQAIEDLYWATMTGNEFLFNH